MRKLLIHKSIRKNLEDVDSETKKELAQLLDFLLAGENLGLPVSRPMPIVFHGVHELRLKDKSGQLRIFYYTKNRDSILVFHMYRKKTQTTPEQEINTARKRLRDLL